MSNFKRLYTRTDSFYDNTLKCLEQNRRDCKTLRDLHDYQVDHNCLVEMEIMSDADVKIN